MWKKYLNVDTSWGSIFFLQIIFCYIIIKFVVNKTEKILKEEEKEKELYEEEIKNKRLKKINKGNNNKTFYSRYLLRNNRYANKKIKI